MTVFWRCPECRLIFCFRDEFRHEDFMLCRCCGSEWIVSKSGEAKAIETEGGNLFALGPSQRVRPRDTCEQPHS